MSEKFSIGAMAKALKKRISGATPDETQQGAQEGAEEISKALPSAVMPRAAILKKRKQLQDIDDATKE